MFPDDTSSVDVNTLRTGDADLRLYAYKQFKYPVPNVLTNPAHLDIEGTAIFFGEV
jgi:hypothetical protein